ncbi:MAG: DUF4440 domain-containing protein [Solirubrobacteraceae bacterium]|nr:DUF4440 domain-containing protein [Solirubrobacteraceae bacterium]
MRWHIDDPAGNAALADLVELEHVLLDPQIRADPDRVRSLLHEDFEEVGASGRHWHRDAIVDALAGEPGHGHETSQVDAHFVTPDAVLITYAARTLDEHHRVSRRSSLWIRDAHGWALRYHQGTPVQ